MTMLDFTPEQMREGNRNYWTIEAMARYGGSFVKALAECARRADRENLEKIKAAWPQYWADYLEIGKKLEKETYPDEFEEKSPG